MTKTSTAWLPDSLEIPKSKKNPDRKSNDEKRSMKLSKHCTPTSYSYEHHIKPKSFSYEKRIKPTSYTNEIKPHRNTDKIENKRSATKDKRQPQHFTSAERTKEVEPQTIILESRIVTERGKENTGENGLQNNILSCLTSRRAVIMIIAYAVIATGLWTYLFNLSFNFPGKEEQIDLLEEQVSLLGAETLELTEQVDRLQNEVVKLGDETDRLEGINEEIKNTARELNDTITIFEDLNGDVNDSTEVYKELNMELSASLSEAAAINDLLGSSIEALENEVTNLNILHLDLTGAVTALEEQNSNYNENIDELELANDQANAALDQLQNELSVIKEQNTELDKNNNHLESILAFLTQTGIDLDTTVDELTIYLSNEIDENSGLVLLSLEHSYQNVYKYWTATGIFDNLFENKSWFQNKDLPLGSDEYTALMDYIEEFIISEVCADQSDFENFLVNDPVIDYSGSSPPVNISFRSLRAGIERYFTALMNHYFSINENGLAKKVWVEAEFDCKNLAPSKLFTWS